MNIPEEKLELMKLLIETESEDVINEIKSVFKRNDPDFWNDLPVNVKESISCGLKDVEEKNLYSHDWIMKETKEKYGTRNNLD